MRLAKLNMGCGSRVREGFVNADIVRLPGVDVVCNFARFPWPFRDNTFGEVLALDVLEHLPDTLRTMEELYRVTRGGATITIKVPHYKHSNAYKDPTHVRFFMEESFDYFGKNEYSFYTKARFEVVRVEKQYEYHIEKYVRRLFPRLLPLVERYLDNTIVSLVFTLEKVKDGTGPAGPTR